MKKMFLAAVVFFMAQASMAVGMSKVQLEANTKPYAERIEKAKERFAGDFMKDEATKKEISNALDGIVRSSGAGDTAAFMKLLNTNSTRSVLMEISRLSSIISDKAATEKDISAAKQGLELLALSGRGVEALVRSEQHAKVEQAKVELAVKISEKIARFNDMTSESAKTFAGAYKSALAAGKSPSDALAEARQKSKKNVTEEDIMNCVI